MYAASYIVLIVFVADATFERRYFHGIERLSLNEQSESRVWTGSTRNKSEGNEIEIPVSVPGGIYSDLEKQGFFPTPIFHEYNDQEVMWVGRQDWNYTRSFAVHETLIRKSKIVLVCEGLDTVAQVFVNDQMIGAGENMFVRYTYDIKSTLKLGENVLRIVFQSPVIYADEQYTRHTENFGYSIYPSKVANGFRGESRVQMIRKIQSSFSWDWGPSYANVGIWKPIYIEGFDSVIIRDVLVFTSPSNIIPDETSFTQWNVTTRVYYDSGRDGEAILELSREKSPRLITRVRLEHGTGKSVDIYTTESGDVVKLWWPNGYGHQNLYWYNLTLSSDTESSSQSLRIGFRTVKLVEDYVESIKPSRGREFYLLVNGIKIYSKGSNTVPLHALPERITETHTEWLLRAAQMSHQNLIRVWGGGMYESETFYDFADEYGIMVWEDFKFACALYPATPEFLQNVVREVDTQVKRLQHRPSLVLWAGNNEVEGGIMSGWWDMYAYFESYASDYVKLYVDTIKTRVEELDPSRRYLASSPSNGKKSEEEDWLAFEPYDFRYGDFHFYNYKLDDWDWHTFPRTRYASEYGYQSCPYYDTLADVADNVSTWTWSSNMMEHRQRHLRGLQQLFHFITMHFPTSPGNKDKFNPKALPLLLYLAQVTQAVGQKTQTEFYRRLQDKLAENGTGHNMGALYWQLNDVWQGCSWASVEVKGRWKLLMYYAKTFFAPVLASPYKNYRGDVIIELISDLPKEFSGELNVRVFKLNSLQPVYEQTVSVQATFLTSKEVFAIKHADLRVLGCDSESGTKTVDPCFVYIRLPPSPDNFLLLQYPTESESIPDPNLQVGAFSDLGDNKTVRFNLTTSSVALFVFLTVRGDHMGYFSENGFILVESSKELTYYSETGITSQDLRNRLEVVSLHDVARFVRST